MARLNLARTLSHSAVNGPGERFVIWTQGCPLACPGCWNQDTWSFARQTLTTTAALIDEILSTQGIEGITLTGGEPFAQARALTEVAQAVKQAGLSVFVFTGYDLEELTSPEQRALLELVDVLVAGRYQRDKRDLSLTWRGSRNQTVHFLSTRYGPAALDQAPELEVHIQPNGTMTFTGFPPEAMWRVPTPSVQVQGSANMVEEGTRRQDSA